MTHVPNIVIKFGGTSVATKEAVLAIVAIVKRYRAEGPVVVVSAIRGVTEALLALAKCPKAEISSHISAIRATHEKLASALFPAERLADILGYVDAELAKTETLARSGEFSPANMDALVSAGAIMSSYIISHALRAHEINSVQVI